MRRRLVSLLALVTAALGTTFMVPAHAAVNGFVTVMSGSQERPGPGDPDGLGVATVILDSGTGSVCVRWRVLNISPAVAAHIHFAPAGVPGKVVVPLPAPVGSSSSGCTTADRGLVQQIIDHPAAYYVNVHTSEFPGGAIRGQLA
jgi:hypothetical protein